MSDHGRTQWYRFHVPKAKRTPVYISDNGRKVALLFARIQGGRLVTEDPPRPFGPRPPDEPRICPACGRAILTGQYTGLVPLGPGADSAEQERARAGGPFHAVCAELHWACLTGSAERPATEEENDAHP